jgi:hypothetical protein
VGNSLWLNKDWSFLGAKLVDTGSTKKGINLIGKLYDKRFWKKQFFKEYQRSPWHSKESPV